MVAESKRIIESGLGKMPERTVDRSYPEVAQALRKRVRTILNEWRKQTILEHPEFNRLTVTEFYNEIERTLIVMAGALESSDRSRWLGLAEISTSHGYDRFNLDYTLADLLAEERTLRRVIIEQVQRELKRDLTSDEAVALQTAIDFMLQQGVLAMVQEQKEILRAASESQVKYLSFLSHDLANNLMVLRLRLEAVKRRLEETDMDDCGEMIASALNTIERTVQGTRRLVQYQSLRKRKIRPSFTTVKLRDAVLLLVDVIESFAHLRKVRFDVRVDPAAVAHTDPNLLALVLQNLINNAVKHAKPEGGSVIIDATQVEGPDKIALWRVSISDEGPGMDQETRSAIVDACRDNEELGARGLGLGMAIVCQASQLLKTSLEINTPPQGGTEFVFMLPAIEAQD